MSKPIVAIVGRPNVGKSTFFNKVVGRRISIVEDTPGVTRDRIIAEAEWTGHHFFLIDTGGIEPDSKEIIPAQMRMQAELAMDMADVVLFMVDGREGLTSADEEVAQMLRRTGKNYIGFCPFHENTRTPSFVVFPDSGTWRCFGQCSEGGDWRIITEFRKFAVFTHLITTVSG